MIAEKRKVFFLFFLVVLLKVWSPTFGYRTCMCHGVWSSTLYDMIRVHLPCK